MKVGDTYQLACGVRVRVVDFWVGTNERVLFKLSLTVQNDVSEESIYLQRRRIQDSAGFLDAEGNEIADASATSLELVVAASSIPGLKTLLADLEQVVQETHDAK